MLELLPGDLRRFIAGTMIIGFFPEALDALPGDMIVCRVM